MELAEFLARESIRDLVARYNSYGDAGRFDQMLELFAPDAVLQIRDQEYAGHDEIRSVFTRVPKRTADATGAGRPAYIRHCTATHQIDFVDETHASGRCYFFVLTQVGLDHWGRYIDEYAVVADRWRFVRRRVAPDAVAPESLFAGGNSSS